MAKVRTTRRARAVALVAASMLAAGGAVTAQAAQLSIANINMQPGVTDVVVVSGNITAESTFGLNILVEIVGRTGNTGTVTFTVAPPVDIAQTGDAWPGAGTFTPLDTDSSSSATLNGAIDDNGTFVAGPLTFSGSLASFPIVASADAAGVWDVLLSTSAGPSSWEGLPTTLVAATITVVLSGCATDPQCDDGVFCNGAETCVNSACVPGGDPCAPRLCNEAADLCTDCLGAPDCDDGQFCNGAEACSAGACVAGANPCPGRGCDEVGDLCVALGATLSVVSLEAQPGSTANLDVAGVIDAEATFGVNLFVELIPRAGNTGSIVFTPAPPDDIVLLGDPWGGIGTFTSFDTNGTLSSMLNGAILDNGTFVPAPVTFTGTIARFPVSVSANAGGSWDVVLSTGSGVSGWEGVTTTLNAGTISIRPPVSIRVRTMAMPPGATADLIVSGEVQSLQTFGVTVLVELTPRAGVTGTLTFTPAPPVDVAQLGDPWPGRGSFTTFDTDTTGSPTLNGSVDDNGSFLPELLVFDNQLARFPVVASAGADGVWDVSLTSSFGSSVWEGLTSVLVNGTITVTPGACVVNADCDDVNTCTTDACDAGICSHTVVVGACDDGDLCTQNDTCSGTTCIGTPVDCTSLNGVCAVGVCNAATGACVPAAANEGGACDDASLCTLTDVCVLGVCTGTPTDCSAFTDTCNVGACNPADGLCFASPANGGGACDDLDPCTSGDLCSAGVCVGTFIPGCVNCTVPAECDDANLCTGDSCVGGVCQHVDLTDPCDDGNPCTSADVCGGGACAGTIIPGCQNCTIAADCNDANVCTSDACTGGTCQHTNLTTACNDGNACTVTDRCSGGACVGTPKDCSAFANACNIGECVPSTGACRSTPTNGGGACDDGYACTTGDVCASGVCGGTLVGTPSVNLAIGPGTQVVQRGQTVSVDLVASSGTCVNQLVGAAEAILTWDPLRLQLTGYRRTGANLWLNSGFPNDVGLDGLNAPFTAVPGNDGNALWQGIQNFQTGVAIPQSGVTIVSFDFLAIAGTVSTTIGIASTFGSFTQTRVLAAGASAGANVTGTLSAATVQITECQTNADCNDANGCTTDTCVTGVCQNVNNTLPCSDGSFCTSNDTCSSGQCVGGANPCVSPQFCSEALDACVACLTSANCNDNNVCTTDVCTATGACQFNNNTLSCNDGLFCTGTDTCAGGSCSVHTGSPCSGSTAVCDETGDRCVNCLNASDCNDNNVCTTDSCVGNVCQRTNNTLPCSDGFFCTASDVCASGLCVGVGNPCTAPSLCSETFDACVQCLVDGDCNDSNVCTTDTCSFGVCSYANNTLGCNDGNFCTATDTCSLGACVGSGNACPGRLCDGPNSRCVDCFTVADCTSDGVACTVDACTNGACTHTPDNAVCANGVFCDGVEVCNAVLGCSSPGNPCDDPALCDETNNLCGCRDPIVVAEGSRYLGITPKPGSTPVALRVTSTDPGMTCLDRYVAANGTLGTTPVFKAPDGASGWGTVHVRGTEIQPSTSYVIRAECDTGQGIGQSVPAGGQTWRWGDANNSGGLVDVIDITLLVDAFRGVFTLTTREATDLWGADAAQCTPQRVIDVVDLTRVIDAFSGLAFPCPRPCP